MIMVIICLHNGKQKVAAHTSVSGEFVVCRRVGVCCLTLCCTVYTVSSHFQHECAFLGLTIVSTYRTISLNLAGPEVTGDKYRMESDDISVFGGVRTLVVHESESVLNITYINNLAEYSIVHIHGINPSENSDGEDGFPLYSSWLILPGESKNIHYALRQSGTYFLHSHFNMQQERGLVLPLIIREALLPPG
jgi:hypothetical protein